MNHKLVSGIIVVLALFSSSTLLIAQEPAAPGKVAESRVDAAVKKACEYLKSQQLADGSWDYQDGPFTLKMPGVDTHLVEGCTALCVYALLKGGEPAKSPAVEKGFAFIRSKSFKHVYSVACYVLALSALYTTDEAEEKEEEKVSEEEKMRTSLKEDPAKEFQKKATPQDKQLVLDAIDWLLKQQQANIWRYPMHGEDASNTQYVMLAFNEARRLNIPIPPAACMKVVDYFLRYQEKSGPEVEWFPVPGADQSFKDMRKIEKELKKEIGKIDKELAKDKDKEKADGLTTSVVDEARKKLFEGEKKKMFARGWCYMPNDPENQAWRKEITGSMTTSGVIALTVCKSLLEGTSEYTADLASKVNQGIRDGCAWLAHKFTVSQNPTGSGAQTIHHYYYLYGLERAGILTLCLKFGKHDWYEEGANLILSQQRPDGSWLAPQGTSGPVPDTCFAILFLKKATTPIVNVPETPYTGEGLLGPKKK